jgi:hypothetical protein
VSKKRRSTHTQGFRGTLFFKWLENNEWKVKMKKAMFLMCVFVCMPVFFHTSVFVISNVVFSIAVNECQSVSARHSLTTSKDAFF